jgi:hypothetical protein
MNAVPQTMVAAEKKTRYKKRLVIIGAFFFRGGLRITAGSTGSTPND